MTKVHVFRAKSALLAREPNQENWSDSPVKAQSLGFSLLGSQAVRFFDAGGRRPKWHWKRTHVVMKSMSASDPRRTSQDLLNTRGSVPCPWSCSRRRTCSNPRAPADSPSPTIRWFSRVPARQSALRARAPRQQRDLHANLFQGRGRPRGLSTTLCNRFVPKPVRSGVENRPRWFTAKDVAPLNQMEIAGDELDVVVVKGFGTFARVWCPHVSLVSTDEMGV